MKVDLMIPLEMATPPIGTPVLVRLSNGSLEEDRFNGAQFYRNPDASSWIHVKSCSCASRRFDNEFLKENRCQKCNARWKTKKEVVVA